MKNILLFEPDKETKTLFSRWLGDVGYAVSSTDSLEKISLLLTEKKFNILIVDIDFSEDVNTTLNLCTTLKNDPHFSNLPIAVLTYKNDSKKMAMAVEAGIDSFMIKPFEADSFLSRLDIIFDEYKDRIERKKVVDLNYINYLIELGCKAEREGFFVLAPVIFNKLIIEKIDKVLGPPIVAQIIKRVNEMVGIDYEFMKLAELSGNRLSFNGVDDASKEVPVKKITTAYRDYVYAFLYLVKMLTSDILIEKWGGEEDFRLTVDG